MLLLHYTGNPSLCLIVYFGNFPPEKVLKADRSWRDDGGIKLLS